MAEVVVAVDTLEQRERVELLRDRDGAGTASQPALLPSAGESGKEEREEREPRSEGEMTAKLPSGLLIFLERSPGEAGEKAGTGRGKPRAGSSGLTSLACLVSISDLVGRLDDILENT